MIVVFDGCVAARMVSFRTSGFLSTLFNSNVWRFVLGRISRKLHELRFVAADPTVRMVPTEVRAEFLRSQDVEQIQAVRLIEVRLEVDEDEGQGLCKTGRIHFGMIRVASRMDAGLGAALPDFREGRGSASTLWKKATTVEPPNGDKLIRIIERLWTAGSTVFPSHFDSDEFGEPTHSRIMAFVDGATDTPNMNVVAREMRRGRHLPLSIEFEPGRSGAEAMRDVLQEEKILLGTLQF